MNIIIEGPNGTGKTTFINKLLACKEFENYNVEHLTASCPNDYEFHKRLLLNDNTIFDRFFIGEMVYPKIYKRAFKISTHEIQQLCNDFADSTIIVFIDADYGFICDSLKKRGEEIDMNFIDTEKQLFNEAVDSLKNIKIYKIKHHATGCLYGSEKSDDYYINKIRNDYTEMK